MSCDITSREELIPYNNNIDANVTDLVNDCPHVCVLVYGSGNPDLAGIGVS